MARPRHSYGVLPRARTADVCIIGGGPAGATIAHRLASLGHEVCLIERDANPRPHVGASLPATILPLLDVIGARDRVEDARFLRPERIVVWWSDANPSIRPLPGEPGLHVDRGAFDRLLVQNAAANGVAVIQPGHALPPERLGVGGWRIPFRHEGRLEEIVARFLVDASGGRNALPGRRRRLSAPLLALYAEWNLAGCGTEGCVEAGENEWFWCAPTSPETAVAAVFIDPKRLSGVINGSVAIAYHELLARFRLFRTNDARRRAGRVTACDASSRAAELSAGPDFVRAGDACLTLDPLSSQGVQTAVASGLQGAIVVNTLLRRPNNSEAAVEFHRQRQQERARRYSTKTAAFYAQRAAVCDTPFWRQRANFTDFGTRPGLQDDRLEPTCKLGLSAHAQIRTMPVVQGDLIAEASVLCHALLEGAVSFVGGVEAVPLVSRIRPGQTAEEIVAIWSKRVPMDLSWNILRWLWLHRIVVTPDDSTCPSGETTMMVHSAAS